jgi:hypothetical protein
MFSEEYGFRRDILRRVCAIDIGHYFFSVAGPVVDIVFRVSVAYGIR